ncbi:hypothetical protein [Halobacterium zhouii]|uniref:hypothetical protein n=1 Tax=Halobacterium zhouii TaxID=2902624 RepID=UPI001E3BE32B|nr:hypothetical protein [Halobacterium zhouii]
MVWLIDNITTAVDLFGTVARTDPLSAVLLALGGLLVAFSSAIFGYLALGGLLEPLAPEHLDHPARRERT